MVFVNLTPHPIVLRDESGNDTIVPPSGTVALVNCTPGDRREEYKGFPVPVMGHDSGFEVVGLPPVSNCPCIDEWGAEPHCELCAGRGVEVYYLVSCTVSSHMSFSRNDVLVPGTGPNDGAVRDEAGRIIAVTRLKMV